MRRTYNVERITDKTGLLKPAEILKPEVSRG